MSATRRSLLPASALLALAVSRRAGAHALVTASEPPVGAVLADRPARLLLHFNSRIDRARSRMVLYAPDNGQTPLPLDSGGDPTVLEARTDIVPWTPGTWRLRWQVLALDGHITRGDVPFTLQPR